MTKSRRPPAKRPPPRKQTIEVDTSWLEEDAPAKRSTKPSRRPERNKTIEVELTWLEPESVRPPAPGKRAARPPPLPREEPGVLSKPQRKHPPPLPREEPGEKPRRR